MGREPVKQYGNVWREFSRPDLAKEASPQGPRCCQRVPRAKRSPPLMGAPPSPQGVMQVLSDSGLDWTFSRTEPFNGTVMYVDGGNTTFSTRERPKFVYSDETMTRPVAVITGVSQSFGYVDGLTLVSPT